MQRARVFFLVGPTASGKTALSIQLAKRMNAEILSADSIQLYKGLDIGSAKPTLEERQGIPHHMLNVAEITERDFSAAKYRDQAQACIKDILSRGKRPLVVGGTGLYIHALTHVLHFSESMADEDMRLTMKAEEEACPGSLYKRLQEADPASAARLHPNDIKRVIRALEVYMLSGRTVSDRGVDFHKTDDALPYEVCMVGITMERERLYARIEQRVDQMMEEGLLSEAQALYEAGISPDLPALQGLGYKQLLQYFADPDANTLQGTIDIIKRDTRRFAKRQWTWFKRDERIHWVTIAPDHNLPALTERVYHMFMECEGEGEGSHAKG